MAISIPLDASKFVKSCGMRKLRRLGQASPRTRSMARSKDVLPEPLGPTNAVKVARGISTSSRELPAFKSSNFR